MLELPPCKLIFVCGPVASGKTHLIRRWLERDNHHVLFDGSGEFFDDPTREQIFANPRAVYDRVKRNPYYYRIVYQPGIDREQDFGYVLDALWWINQEKLLVCDEFHEICPVEYKSPPVERLLRFARHDKMGFIGASQRIADVNRLYTSACRMIILFQTNEVRDLEAAEARWGCGDQLSNLRPLLHDDITGVTHQIPQCLVIVKGRAPYIYDFKTESIVGSSQGEREREDMDRPAGDSERAQGTDEPIDETAGERDTPVSGEATE